RLRGELEQQDQNDSKLALGTLSDAIALAVLGRADAVIPEALSLQIESANEAANERAWREAHQWSRQAESWIDRIGGESRLRARVLQHEANVYRTEGRLDEALANYGHALALLGPQGDDSL